MWWFPHLSQETELGWPQVLLECREMMGQRVQEEEASFQELEKRAGADLASICLWLPRR